MHFVLGLARLPRAAHHARSGVEREEHDDGARHAVPDRAGDRIVLERVLHAPFVTQQRIFSGREPEGLFRVDAEQEDGARGVKGGGWQRLGRAIG